MPNKAPSKEIQQKAAAHVQKVFSNYWELLNYLRSQWYQFFKSTFIFETDRNADWQSKIFFPKCWEQVEKIAPRLTNNNPKFVISLNVPINANDPSADMEAYSKVNQKALNYFWKLGDCQKKLRTWAKGGLVYGTMFAKVGFETKTHKKTDTEFDYNVEGDKVTERKITKETVIMEYPTFEVPDLLNVYFDPRIERVDDMPAIIEVSENVRKSDLYQNSHLYFNLDQVKPLASATYLFDSDNYRQNKYNAQGVPTIYNDGDDDIVTLKRYHGYFSETGESEDEELMLITTVNDKIVIQYEPLPFLPFEKFNPMEIPNQGVGKGIVEPIKKIQDAYNLTRNQRFENVSLVINRMWLLKQGSGVDPRKLVSRAGNVIPVKDVDSLVPLTTPDITASAFNETQALNTEIQTILGTIDTTQDTGDNGFTNLATGQKIRWNEYNSRFKAIKQNLEEALGRLGEKMLMMTAVRATQNPLISDEETKQFYEVAKEAFDSFSDFYTVNVLADSTVNDSIENKRDEALAKGQLALAYKAQGVPVNLEKVFKDIMETFPGTNVEDYLTPAAPGQEVPGGSGRPLSESVVDQVKVQQLPEDQLSQQLTSV